MPGIAFPFRAVLAAASLAVLSPAASPDSFDTYKWVDDEGITHYSQHRPPDRPAEVFSASSGALSVGEDAPGCTSISCRAARLERVRLEREQAVEEALERVRRAAAVPVYPTPVSETDAEKIARLVAECKSSRGTNCDSDEEKRRMLLQNVELTHAERRALRGLSPAQQRRALNQRIPKQYRVLD